MHLYLQQGAFQPASNGLSTILTIRSFIRLGRSIHLAVYLHGKYMGMYSGQDMHGANDDSAGGSADSAGCRGWVVATLAQRDSR